ncbi:hypothetical protein EI94DRAFT_1823827 [Lactarius quietus]|nr:hypothetical protein EI94DRAFT_1823827 [Lactarius quietus]
MTIPALWPELESILPARQTCTVYDSAVKYFLSLEETWENCPRCNREVSQWLYYFESAWKSLKRALQLANVNMHPDEVYTFREWVRNKAAPVASVKWISRFPTVITRDIDHLVLRAAVLGCAQADALDMCAVGLTAGDHFPDLVITVMGDIQSLYTREVISYEERCWHLEKFAREHNEMLEGRQAIHDWVAASLQALADESPGLAQLARCTGSARSTALVLGDDSDADGIGEDDLTLPPAYDPSLFLLPVSAGRVLLAYPDAMRRLLFLEESWATCPHSTTAITIWLHYFQLAWDDVCSAIRANGEDQLHEAAEAFRLRVATEAMLVASVDWVRKFPSIAGEYPGRLVLHATIVALSPNACST